MIPSEEMLTAKWQLRCVAIRSPSKSRYASMTPLTAVAVSEHDVPPQVNCDAVGVEARGTILTYATDVHVAPPDRATNRTAEEADRELPAVMLMTLPGELSPDKVITIVLCVAPVVVPVDGTTYSTTCSVLAHAALVVNTPYALPSGETVSRLGALSDTVLQPTTLLVVLVKENPVSSGAAAKLSMLY